MSSETSWAASVRQTRGPSRSLNFPTPFLDYEKFYVPRSVKELFDYIGFTYLSDSNVKPAINSMATYPITELIYSMLEEKDPEKAEPYKVKWKEVLEDKLDVRVFNIMIGLDYFVYGNAFASVYKPFKRLLVCQGCQHEYNAHSKDTSWKWRNMRFIVSCSRCGFDQPAVAKDEPKKGDLENINLVRWNPYHISIKKNPISGRVRYYYDIPQSVRKSIMEGDKEYLLFVQSEILEAVVAKGRGKGTMQIEFDEDALFAMQQPMPSMANEGMLGWGLPLIVASLRDSFFKNTMRRAQSMVLHEHTIPLRIFSPQITDQPSSTLKTSTWKREIQAGYKDWIENPSTIITAPVPINVQQLGGDKGALNLFAEAQVVNTDVIKGMGVPREFVEGALTYSGANVSIRMLENLLMDFVHRSERLVNWICKKIAECTDLIPIDVKYQPFKMADDIQLKQLIAQLRQGKEISHDLLCQYLNADSEEQINKLAQEEVKFAILQAKAQAEAGITLARTQEFWQTVNPSMAANYTPQVSPEMLDQLMQSMQGLPPDQQAAMMQQMGQENPQAAQGLAGKMDLSPAAAMNSLKTIMSTPQQAQGDAMKDMQTLNPAMADMIMKILPYLQQQQPPQRTGFATGGNGSNKSGIGMSKPNPTQRPPRGAGATI